jgi:hypothetical protein
VAVELAAGRHQAGAVGEIGEQLAAERPGGRAACAGVVLQQRQRDQRAQAPLGAALRRPLGRVGGVEPAVAPLRARVAGGGILVHGDGVEALDEPLDGVLDRRAARDGEPRVQGQQPAALREDLHGVRGVLPVGRRAVPQQPVVALLGQQQRAHGGLLLLARGGAREQAQPREAIDQPAGHVDPVPHVVLEHWHGPAEVQREVRSVAGGGVEAGEQAGEGALAGLLQQVGGGSLRGPWLGSVQLGHRGPRSRGLLPAPGGQAPARQHGASR